MSTFAVHVGDCRDVMASMDAASVDAIVCDPPYGLTANKKGGSGEASLNLKSPAGRSRVTTGGGFMGQKWDAAVPDVSYWIEAWRVAKPGAHLIAFGGTRTFHRLACAIEDADWEIRDCLSWLYGSGFPKSLDVSKAIDKARGTAGEWVQQDHPGRAGFRAGDPEIIGQVGRGLRHVYAPGEAGAAWSGWGTALKPAWEPIVLARKPLEGTVAANVQEYGTGALNVDASRIGTSRPPTNAKDFASWRRMEGRDDSQEAERDVRTDVGRWPANVALDEEAAAMLDEQSGERGGGFGTRGRDDGRATFALNRPRLGQKVGFGDSGGASRFFYTAKASRSERGEGNTHPTVKPVDLMRWLVRLVTPPNGLVLDPFMGSGTTGVACVAEGFPFVGIELSPDYAEIARRRIATEQPTLFGAA